MPWRGVSQANCGKGAGGLARRAARFQDAPCSAPPCTAYHVARFPGAVAPGRQPFNSSRPRSAVAARGGTPGRGSGNSAVEGWPFVTSVLHHRLLCGRYEVWIKKLKKASAFIGRFEPLKCSTCGKTFSHKHPALHEKELGSTAVNVDRPGTYNPDARRTVQTQFEHSFGGRKVLRPVVETRCLLGRRAKCGQCGCEPTGDYWEHRGGTALCRPCMAGRQAAASDRREALALNQYKKVRSCWMVHRHEGTVAAIVLMDARSLRRLQEKEAYFQQYFA